jgi:PilZ domain
MARRKSEKRRYKRHVVEGLHGNVLFPSDIQVLNISVDGAAIETSKWLDLNREYTLKIKFKENILSLKGRVIWAVLTSKEKKGSGEVTPVYRAGVKFTDVLNERTQMLMSFIEEHKVRTLEKRLAGVRFKISAPNNMQIDYPHKYKVKKVSLSGMLVDAEYPLDVDIHYSMELFLNADILSIVGRVANCVEVKSERTARYDIGIEFEKLSDKNKVLLKAFLGNLDD